VHPGTSDNIALKPGVVRSALDFVDCEYIEIKKAENSTFEIEHVDFAKQIGSSGALDWKGRKPILQLRNKGDSVSVVSSGEEWIAYGPDGNRVDWE